MNRTTAVLIFLAAMTGSPVLQAADPDAAMCRGDYPVLLMTEQECRQHIRSVESLRTSGQFKALESLRRQHAELLRERAAACLCIDNAPDALPTQHVALSETDC